jgi:uncharacterized membrane protein YqjE
MGDNDTVRAQEERDLKTIAIARAIGLFVLIVGAGVVAMAVLDLSEDTMSTLAFPLFAVAGLAVVLFLFRARNR